MSELNGYTAIEIDGPNVVYMMSAFDPTLNELDYEKDLHRNFFVLHFPEPGKYAVVSADNFGEHFDYIENSATKLRTKLFTTK